MEAAPESPPGTVVGRFDDRHAAEHAVERLHAAGFAMEHVGFLGHSEAGDGEHADAEGALQGAASGSLAGGVLGGLIGAVTTLLLPGVGPIVSAGILSGIVAGVPAGAIVGGIAGALKQAGVHEDAAGRYEREFHDGRTLVTCSGAGRDAEAARIMQEAGGEVESHVGDAGGAGQPRPESVGTPGRERF